MFEPVAFQAQVHRNFNACTVQNAGADPSVFAVFKHAAAQSGFALFAQGGHRFVRNLQVQSFRAKIAFGKRRCFFQQEVVEKNRSLAAGIDINLYFIQRRTIRDVKPDFQFFPTLAVHFYRRTGLKIQNAFCTDGQTAIVARVFKTPYRSSENCSSRGVLPDIAESVLCAFSLGYFAGMAARAGAFRALGGAF